MQVRYWCPFIHSTFWGCLEELFQHLHINFVLGYNCQCFQKVFLLLFWYPLMLLPLLCLLLAEILNDNCRNSSILGIDTIGEVSYCLGVIAIFKHLCLHPCAIRPTSYASLSHDKCLYKNINILR